MLVFLAWSKNQSLVVAKHLSQWIPRVLQGVTTFLSDEDIESGTRWRAELDKNLATSNYGIIVVTPENIDSSWIYYEAGALGKAFGDARVVPLLHGVNPSDIINNPLSGFQTVLPTKEKMFKLVSDINDKFEEGKKLDATLLAETFEVWWPKLETSLSSVVIAEKAVTKKASRTTQTSVAGEAPLLEAILALCQEQVRTLRSPTNVLPPDYLLSVFRDALKDEGRSQSEYKSIVTKFREILHVLHRRIDQGTLTDQKQISIALRKLERIVSLSRNSAHAGDQRIMRDQLSYFLSEWRQSETHVAEAPGEILLADEE